MKFNHGSTAMLSCCAVLILNQMGEKDVMGSGTPACAETYEEFLKNLEKAAMDYNNIYSGAHQVSSDGIRRLYDQPKVNGDPQYIRKNHKVVQCYLTVKQVKARLYLKEFGFTELGPFESDKMKESYKDDIYLYVLSAAEFSDRFWPVRGRKVNEVDETVEEAA